ncbi:pentatricopeptide repeat-containing protein At4g21065-like [Hordeum vulgare subsp. vulgare]|uniref:DYW domain-containing protein n=1 Tax=Hordeum vulgare subsp. vulgare TaxID=112509 RepID=A0A8I6XVA0_HORVV|nr:pentatricopeptide repeat-containing protein At4g21065-like [Hordeum vulgare subsp. vulgare]
MPHRPPLRSPQSRGGPYTTAPPTPTPSRAAEQHCLRLLERAATPASLLQPLAFLLKRGLHSNPLVLTRLFAAAGSAAPALLEPLVAALLRPGLPLDAFLLNTLIRAHVASPLPSARRRAAAFFPLMLRRGVVPNKFTFPFLLKSCAATPGSPATGLQAHAAALKFGFATDHYVSNTLIHMYCCFGAGFLGDARNVFDRTPKDSAVTWSAMIGGYVRGGLSSDAVVLFREMQASGVRPDEVTVLGVLSAAADLGALELTRWVEKFVEREGIGRSVTLCNALIDTLAKCGDVDGAVAVFEGMEERTVVSWTSVIDALAMEGRGREAAAVFEEMKAVGVPPDDVAFIGVLTACSHAGMVDEGRGYFDSMKTEHGIEPKIEHYGCMVDMFGRAGMVDQGLEFVRAMPMKPNPIIWRTLVAACRAHGRLELGESISKDLLNEYPAHEANYVMLSNVFALTQRWKEKSEIRREMSKRGITKVPGCSLVELDGEVHEFIAGDESHLQYKEIYRMVEEMSRELRRIGHIAATSEVLLDLDEEDKEGALQWHSEKLAIAFVLLRTPPGTQVRVVKNLRVCSDCHAAIKCISQVYNREIIVRDRSRFHRFKDGSCSCKDFW